jgi:hypothetical protein
MKTDERRGCGFVARFRLVAVHAFPFILFLKRERKNEGDSWRTIQIKRNVTLVL